MRKVETLIEAAATNAGSQAKLAERLGITRATVTHWKSGSEHVPDRHVLAMARIAGWKPLETAVEVYKERLGELAKTLAIGAVAIMLGFGTAPADAQPAGLIGDNV